MSRALPARTPLARAAFLSVALGCLEPPAASHTDRTRPRHPVLYTRRRHASSRSACTVPRTLTPRTPRWPPPLSFPSFWAASLRPARWPPPPLPFRPLLLSLRLTYGPQSSIVCSTPPSSTRRTSATSSRCSRARRRPTRAAGGRRMRRGRAARPRRARANRCAPRRHMDCGLVQYIYIICVYDMAARAPLSHAPPHGRGGRSRERRRAASHILSNPPTHPRPHSPLHQGKVFPPLPHPAGRPGFERGGGGSLPAPKSPTLSGQGTVNPAHSSATGGVG